MEILNAKIILTGYEIGRILSDHVAGLLNNDAKLRARLGLELGDASVTVRTFTNGQEIHAEIEVTQEAVVVAGVPDVCSKHSHCVLSDRHKGNCRSTQGVIMNTYDDGLGRVGAKPQELCGAVGGGEHQHKTRCARPKGHTGECDP